MDRFEAERALTHWQPGPGAERMMARYARCVTRAEPARMDELFATLPGSEPENTILANLARRYGNCLVGADLRSSPIPMRAAIAERVYLDRFPQPGAQLQPSATPFVANPEASSLFEVARCAALRDPVAADRLVRTDFRTPAETAALGEFMPVLRQCVRQGGEFRFSRVLLHGALAESLLKLQSASGVTAAAPVAAR